MMPSVTSSSSRAARALRAGKAVKAGRGSPMVSRKSLSMSSAPVASTSQSATGKTSFSRNLATETSAVPPVSSGGSGSSSHRVVIVGGGTAGQAAAHQLVQTGLFSSSKTEIAIVDPSPWHHYQPGWTLVGGGLKTREELRRPMKDLVKEEGGIQLIEDSVSTFEPEQNRIKTKEGKTLEYDQLVVCPGLGINWGNIKGLEGAMKEKKNVSSIYSYDSVADVYPQISSMKSGQAIFTQPAGVVKCAGAPQKIMWLATDLWKQSALYDPVDPNRGPIQVTFATGMPTMFAVPKYSQALDAMRKERGIQGLFQHNLTEVNGNVATFSAPEGKTIQRQFDYLHVTPQMGPLPFIKDSPLADPASGFVDVDAGTTQHKKYKNVWSIGDSSSLPTSKTAAAITAETPVLVKNLAAAMQGKKGEETYDGYTSCPLLTEYGKVMLAEFKYGGVPKESFAFLGIDQAVPQRAFYHLKKDFFPWVYFNSHVKGTWRGPKGWKLGGMSSAAQVLRSFGTTTRAMQGSKRGFATSSRVARNTPARRQKDPLDHDPTAVRHALPNGATFIVRSPPTPPSPSNTILAPSPLLTDSSPTSSFPLPPLLHKPSSKRGERLNASQIEQMRLLRKQDPLQNTITKLAKRFGCSRTFVQIVAPLPNEEVRRWRESEVERKRANWGWNKRLQKELQKERRALW